MNKIEAPRRQQIFIMQHNKNKEVIKLTFWMLLELLTFVDASRAVHLHGESLMQQLLQFLC